MNFRESLIKLRNDNKLSQQELADRLNVSRQTITRWESGKNIPSANQIANICNVFHINANEFVETDAPASAPAKGADDSAGTAAQDRARRKLSVTLIAVIAALLLITVCGLIITVVYAVKDAVYDSSATVWIMAIPQNTPMIILSVFLAVFIILLTVLLIYLLRGRKK